MLCTNWLDTLMFTLIDFDSHRANPQCTTATTTYLEILWGNWRHKRLSPRWKPVWYRTEETTMLNDAQWCRRINSFLRSLDPGDSREGSTILQIRPKLSGPTCWGWDQNRNIVCAWCSSNVAETEQVPILVKFRNVSRIEIDSERLHHFGDDDQAKGHAR